MSEEYCIGCPRRETQDAEIEQLRAENAELLAALRDMIEIASRNSEASLMLLAIRKCAEHAIAKAEKP
jgi:hypothetical protein